MSINPAAAGLASRASEALNPKAKDDGKVSQEELKAYAKNAPTAEKKGLQQLIKQFNTWDKAGGKADGFLDTAELSLGMQEVGMLGTENSKPPSHKEAKDFNLKNADQLGIDVEDAAQLKPGDKGYRDGALSMDEIKASKDMGKHLSDQDKFNDIDKDGDGLLQIGELAEARQRSILPEAIGNIIKTIDDMTQSEGGTQGIGNPSKTG